MAELYLFRSIERAKDVGCKQRKENAQPMNTEGAVYDIIGMTHLSQSISNQRIGNRLRISELLALSLLLFRSRLKTILFDHGLVLLGRECL